MPLEGLRSLLQQFRRRKPADLDRIERELIRCNYERREFAGDPRQARKFWVRTRNRK